MTWWRARSRGGSRTQHRVPVAAVVLAVALGATAWSPASADASTDSTSGAGTTQPLTATPPPPRYGPVIAGTYSRPVERPVSDPFRMDAGRYGPGNRGLEYATVVGDPVRAFGGGVVVFAGAVAGRLAVTVQHPDGRRSSLTGLVSMSVVTGETVRRGQLLGRAGAQLHLGLREGERYVDPAPFLPRQRRRAVLVPLGEQASG
ncbi:hypothetical protein BH10ACT3_BH10ACT3_11810 [soil metagenome]